VSDFEDDYTAGDINRIDANDIDNDNDEINDIDDERDDPKGDPTTAAAVLTYIARSLADDPDAVSVETRDQGHRVVLSLNVGPGDMGRVIGRRGRTAQALRTLIGAAGARDGVTTAVDIVD
jgi:uncharacterized protein